MSSTNGYFPGLIDEVGSWNKSLDAAAVTAIYNSGVPIDLRNNSSNYDEYTDNLVGYWRNEGKGRWVDLSGSGNNASENGSPDQVSFPQGTTSERDSQGFPSEISSFIFNETNYISVGDLGTKTNWTISVWWNKFNRDENNIFYMGEAAGFSVWSANIMALYVYKSSSYTHTSTTYTWDTNRWYFLTVNHDGSSNTVKIYINGSLIDTDSIDDHAYHEDFTDVKIGDGGYGKWDGKIGNFMIYDRVLSPTEILHNFNVQRDRFGV